MLYRKQRAQNIAKTLLELSELEAVPLYDWLKKDGTFYRPEEAEADNREWKPFHGENEWWGGADVHCWFRREVEIPAGWDGQAVQLVFLTDYDTWDNTSNPQFLLFEDGAVRQGLDVNHKDYVFSGPAEGGRTIRIDLQAYSGSNPALSRLTAKLVRYAPAVKKLYYHLLIPCRIIEKLDGQDQRRIRMETILEETINLLDLRVKHSPEFFASVDAATAHIETALYEDYAGCDDVIATCIGHTHIDVAWLWTVEQTREKAARSFSTVLKLMEEYPDYTFMSSQPQLYQFVKQRYPELYEKIKQRIKEGRWEAEGGMWLEADCNVTSGESLVRQFLHGKRFFKQEFGVDSKILWLPDVFGYSVALPQILKKCGIDYFMTTKISWNQVNKLPCDTFWWRGLDGTEVFTHFITTLFPDWKRGDIETTYNGQLHPASLMGAWDRYQQKDINNDVLISFGYGDGGGGPDREMLETGMRLAKGLPGAPKVRIEPARTYFDELLQRVGDSRRLPKWVGELYLEYHRGTYTSMARNKRDNRRCELLYQDIEFFSRWAQLLGGDYPQQKLYENWETILLNQFHDILPGSSIREVYDVTREEYGKLLADGVELLAQSLHTLVSRIGAPEGSVAVFNSLSFDRQDIAVIEDTGVDAFTDLHGNPVAVQKTAGGKLLALAPPVPAKGYTVLRPASQAAQPAPAFTVADNGIDTADYTIEWNAKGHIVRWLDKRSGREVVPSGREANVLRVFEDRPMQYDNWDIDIYYQQKSWAADNVQKMGWTENGPVRATFAIERKFLDSVIRQELHFYRHTPRVDFETYVDWKQSQLLMKAEFPVDVRADSATYEVQFGNVQRPTHWNTSWDLARFEVCGHKWADLSEAGFGVSLLNNCKYGYDIKDSVMRLTLIKSGVHPSPVTDQEEHFFTYSLYPHEGDWRQARTAREGYALNVPLYAAAVPAGMGGALPAQAALLRVDAPNVMLETVKLAEDGEGTIVRLYEFENRRSTVQVTWNGPVEQVMECDLLENTEQTLPVSDGCFSFTIKPYEIKTFRIQ